jgi:hypothetical protein
MFKHPDAKKLMSKRVVPIHRFDVGAKVLCNAHNGPAFEVTKLLPDGGQGFQYRIRSLTDGRERVVVERMLRAAPKIALSSGSATRH